MQYINGMTDDDLKTGNTSYVLDATDDQVKFYAYTGDTAFGSRQQTYAEIGNLFLRKGFSD